MGILKTLRNYSRLIFDGSITIKTSVSPGANVHQEYGEFQTILESDGDMMNVIPNPSTCTDAESRKAWLDAANRHFQLMAEELNFMKHIPLMASVLSVLIVLLWMSGDLRALLTSLPNSSELAHDFRMLLKNPLTEGAAALKEFIFERWHLATGALVLFFRGKLLGWLLRSLAKVLGNALFTRIKKWVAGIISKPAEKGAV